MLKQFMLLIWIGALSVTTAAPSYAQDLATMAGQMIMVGFQGTSVDAAGVAAVRADIAAGRVGGVMYLRTNVTSLAAVDAMNRSFLAASEDLPPLIAIDQEGGSVERLTKAVGFTEIASAERIATGNVDAAERIYFDLAQRLHDLGFNVNFGPVVDLDLNPANPVIGKFGRAFSEDANVVGAFAEAFVSAHRRAGVLTALKHFPGHGSSADDSHEGFTDISATWQERELQPYEMLISDDLVDMVMVGHLFHDRYGEVETGQQLPASLSPMWIDQTLRRTLGFNGVVISDDMEMGAIRAHYGFADSIIKAVWARTDILLFSNTADARTTLAAEVQKILVDEASNDAHFRDRIEESYQRIVAMKRGLNP